MSTPDSEADTPIWARDDAFPAAPPGWGWVDFKGIRHACADDASLIRAVREDPGAGVALVWTPSGERMVLPEELPEAASAVLEARRRRAAFELAESVDRLRWFAWLSAGLAVYLLYLGWHHPLRPPSPGAALRFLGSILLHSPSVGIALLMFLMFAFIPWYQAGKRVRELLSWDTADLESVVPILRFETWLDWQKSPVTRWIFGLTALTGLAQLLPGDSLAAAGLLKDRYLAGEWWRLFTAPLLHGHPLHFMMNAAALLYLGKRVEVFARWPHVPLVFLFAACIGGEASARFLAAPSVGASGGLMGWLGFLLVFESLHGRLVPRRASRRLLAGVVLTGVIGVIGFRFIDNAAHLGGLLAGMVYAAIVFPRSTSALRPRATLADRIAGIAALIVLHAATACAVWRMLDGMP